MIFIETPPQAIPPLSDDGHSEDTVLDDMPMLPDNQLRDIWHYTSRPIFDAATSEHSATASQPTSDELRYIFLTTPSSHHQ